VNRIVEADKKVLDKTTQMSRMTQESCRPRVSPETSCYAAAASMIWNPRAAAFRLRDLICRLRC
jgi:hypothetical protein